MKLEHFGKYIINTWKVSKCSVGEGWRGSDGLIVCEMKYYTQLMEERNNLQTIQRRKANCIAHILHIK